MCKIKAVKEQYLGCLYYPKQHQNQYALKFL